MRRRLQGPWKGLHTAIWLIGLAILFYTGRFWPGILILVAASTIIEMVISSAVPGSTEEVEDNGFHRPRAGVEEGRPFPPPPPPPPAPSVPDPSVIAANELVRRVDLLPTNCPRCGAPARGHDVKWTGSNSADCSFCGSPLPMSKA
jgi:hypothetical protein